MRRTNVTLQDIANEAGISKTTAASILRNARGFQISDTTRQRVIEASVRLGYRRNAIAASLSLGRTQVIGFLMHVGTSRSLSVGSASYGLSLFVALVNAATRADMRVIPIPIALDSSGEQPLHSVTDRQIDGLVFSSFYQSGFLDAVENAGVPCVEINSDMGKHIVQPDNEGGAESAVSHFAMLGHRRIAHWHGRLQSYAGQGRYTGFMEAAERFGLSTTAVGDADGVRGMLRQPQSQRPTAIFTFNDYYAGVTMEIARELDLRVPDDLSIIGFDDNVIAQILYPKLTTVHNPVDEEADAAITLLKARLEGGKTEGARIVLPTQLVVRNSTATPTE